MNTTKFCLLSKPPFQSSDIDTNVSFISSMRIISRPNGPYCPGPFVCTGGPKAGYALMESQLTIFLRIDVSDVAHVDAPESKIT